MDIRDNFITNVYQEEVYFVSVARCLDSSVGMLYYGNRDNKAFKEMATQTIFLCEFLFLKCNHFNDNLGMVE